MTSLERMELTVSPRLLIQLASEQPTYTLSALVGSASGAVELMQFHALGAEALPYR